MVVQMCARQFGVVPSVVYVRVIIFSVFGSDFFFA